MGAVLAMTQGMKQVLFGLILSGLTACGSLGDDGIGAQVAEVAVGIATGQGTEAAPAPASASQEDILSNPSNYLRVNIRNLDRWATMVPAATNGSRVTWVDSQNVTITIEDGIVVATRGTIQDLMGASADQTLAVMRAGGGDAQRTHEFLDDNDQIAQEVLQCSIASQGADTVTRFEQSLNAQKFEELCRGERLTLTNVYWINSGGKILRSLQAVSPGAGYVQIDAF